MTIHRVRKMHIVARETIGSDRITCLMAGFRQVFTGFDKLQQGHVEKNFPHPYGTYGEAKVLRRPDAFAGALVVYAQQTQLPEREWQAVLKAGGYPVFGYFFAEQPKSKQLTLGAYNLRHNLIFHQDHDNTWLCRSTPADTYGEWPGIVFEPASTRAA